MTAEEFTVQIMDMKKTLYHVSCGILRSEADREDAVQECICKAWEKRNSLKSEGAFRAWVTRILINECYDICRRGSKIVLLDEMPEAVAPESGDRELCLVLVAGLASVKTQQADFPTLILCRGLQHTGDITYFADPRRYGQIPAVCRARKAPRSFG